MRVLGPMSSHKGSFAPERDSRHRAARRAFHTLKRFCTCKHTLSALNRLPLLPVSLRHQSQPLKPLRRSQLTWTRLLQW